MERFAWLRVSWTPDSAVPWHQPACTATAGGRGPSAIGTACIWIRLSGIGDRMRELPWPGRGARGRQWNGQDHRESGASLARRDWRNRSACTATRAVIPGCCSRARTTPIFALARGSTPHWPFSESLPAARRGFIGASLRHAVQQVFCGEQRETELLHLSRPHRGRHRRRRRPFIAASA